MSPPGKQMKKAVVAIFLAALATGVYAQGHVALDNHINEEWNDSTNPFATIHGLFWLSTAGIPVLINQDFNAAFYAGTDPGALPLIARFLLSDGTAVADNAFAPGTFIDPTLNVYTIPGAYVSAFFQIQAWTGNFDSYAAAVSAGAPTAQSSVFLDSVGVPPTPPAPLTGMPAMVLSVIPEPSTTALVGFAGLIWLFAGCRKLRQNPTPGSPRTSSPAEKPLSMAARLFRTAHPPPTWTPVGNSTPAKPAAHGVLHALDDGQLRRGHGGGFFRFKCHELCWRILYLAVIQRCHARKTQTDSTRQRHV
jgi:hypothetical protein